jgi:fucose permease
VSGSPRLLLAVALLAFVSLGLPDAVLGVAWPSIRRTFDLPLSQLGALLASAMAGYLVSAFCSGALVARFGVGRLLLGSSLTMVISLLGYAAAPSWPVMVALGVLTGLGAGAIDAGVNAFAALRFSPRTVNWLHASYGVGAALGPILLASLMAAGWGWRWGYGLIAAALASLTACFALTRQLWSAARATTDIAPDPTAAPVAEAAAVGTVAALRRPPVQLSLLVFFVYTGLEATAGHWSYSVLTESRGMATGAAATAVAFYWAGLTAGRILSGALARRYSPGSLLRAGLVGSPLAAAVLWLAPGRPGALLALALLGLAFAPVFPLLISLTPARVGARYAPHAVGFQVAAAYLGAAALPGAAGLLARSAGLEAIPPFMLAIAMLLLGLQEVAARRAAGERAATSPPPDPPSGRPRPAAWRRRRRSAGTPRPA